MQKESGFYHYSLKIEHDGIFDLPFLVLRDGFLDGHGVEALEGVEPLEAVQLQVL